MTEAEIEKLRAASNAAEPPLSDASRAMLQAGIEAVQAGKVHRLDLASLAPSDDDAAWNAYRTALKAKGGQP